MEGMETMDDEKFGGDTSEMEVLDESGLKSTERAQNDRVNEEGMAWSDDQVISSRMADLTGRCSHDKLIWLDDSCLKSLVQYFVIFYFLHCS